MKFKEALIAHLNGEKVECKATDSKWSDSVGCFGHISMGKLRDLTYVGWEFRLAPRTITVNGVEVPAPESVAPQNGETYYVPATWSENMFDEVLYWEGDSTDFLSLERGLVYLNKEDAIIRAKAMLITEEKCMDKEQAIKEVMDLVDEYASEYVDYTNNFPSDSVTLLVKIEFKLRELLK